MPRASAIVSDQNRETDVLDEIAVIGTNQELGESFKGMV